MSSKNTVIMLDLNFVGKKSRDADIYVNYYC